MKQGINRPFNQKEHRRYEMKITKNPLLDFEKIEIRSSDFSNAPTPTGC
jgi:hypothetical protein